MRFVLRSLGLFLAAGAFVAVIIDVTRSIADNAWRAVPVGVVWAWLDSGSLIRAQGWVEATFSAFVWNIIVLPVLSLPFALLLIVASALCFWFGRRPRDDIGYVSHI